MNTHAKNRRPSVTTGSIRAMLLQIADEREGKSFCPSEAARALSDDWRPLMQPIREQGACLTAEGLLRCTQRGQDCDPLSARGAIRFSKAQPGGS